MGISRWILDRLSGGSTSAVQGGQDNKSGQTGDHSPGRIGNGNTMQRAEDHGTIDQRHVGDVHSAGPTNLDQSRGMDGEEVNRIIETILEYNNRVIADILRHNNLALSQQVQDGLVPTLAAQEEVREQLAAVITSMQNLADKGESRAALAIQQAKDSGDTKLMLDLLVEEYDRNTGERLQLNREIMAVAYLRGDIARAAGAVTEILRALPDDLGALNFRGCIDGLQGRLQDAEEAYSRILKLSLPSQHLRARAAAYGNIGVICRIRGDLDRAEEMHRKALEIEKELAHEEGIANQYGNLGNVYGIRGDLDQAEEMHRKALEIETQLDYKEGIARQYGNLGFIYGARGNSTLAEDFLRKALQLNQQLGNREGMAVNYSNLGAVFLTRRDPDQAEPMLRKALEIDEHLGRKHGMAKHYGNLGLVYRYRDDLDRAGKMFHKSLEINEQLDLKEGMAADYPGLFTTPTVLRRTQVRSVA